MQRQRFEKLPVSNHEEGLRNFALCGKKIIGTALNFIDNVHVRKERVPREPYFFLKPTTTYITEGQDIVLPKCLRNIIFEVEMGVIIARTCRSIEKEDAMDYVGGYCLALDMTAIDELAEARTRTLPWTVAKSFDTATPVSRLIHTREVRDPYNLSIWVKVNGVMRQKSNTKNLIFRLPDLIAIASKDMTLQRMDMILTGTPPGAGTVNPGDIIECGLSNIVKMTFKVRK